MTMRILIRCAALAAAICSIQAVPAAGAPQRHDGTALSALDADRALRGALDPALVERLTERFQREPVRGSVWTETLFDTLAVASAALDEVVRQAPPNEARRVETAALVSLLAVDRVVELHPELAPAVTSTLLDDGPTPIERICRCDKQGSRACGCRVMSTGPGECEYRVLCPTFLSAGCSAVNVEMCVAETVIDIISPIK